MFTVAKRYLGQCEYTDANTCVTRDFEASAKWSRHRTKSFVPLVAIDDINLQAVSRF